MKLKVIQEAIQKNIVQQNIPDPSFFINRIECLPIKEENENILYVIKAEDAKETVFTSCSTQRVFIISKKDSMEEQPEELPLNCIQTDLEFEELLQSVFFAFHRFAGKMFRFRQTALENKSLADMVSLAAELLDADLFLLNSGFHIIHYALMNEEEDKKTELEKEAYSQLLEEGFLSSKKVTALKGSEEYGIRYIFQNIHHKTSLTAVLFVRTSLPATEFQKALLNEITEILKLQFQRRLLIDYSGDAFGDFAIDLIERRVKSDTEIRERLNTMHKSFDRRFCLAVLEFNDLSIVSSTYLVGKLKEIFNNVEIFKYQNEMVLLPYVDQSNAPVISDIEKLEELLEENDAYIGFSPRSSRLRIIPTLYYQARTAIRLGRIFKEDNNRYFYFMDYYIYHIIEMCMDPAHRDYHNGNMGFLAHPAWVALERHDVKNQDNLRDVLYTYLTNNLNGIQTAKKLFMHRNTLSNKLLKIESLIGRSLDDQLLRQNLTFSAAVYHYAKVVYEKNFLDFSI